MNSFGQFALPCRASALRGKLKHSYLENAVCLPALPEDLNESLAYRERGIARHEIIRQLIDEFTCMMGSVEEGFSPAQLVDRLCPFRDLSEAQRHLLKAELHSRFIQDFQLAERKQHFERVAESFLMALDLVVAPSPRDAKSTLIQMAQVQDSARALIRELEAFPKGIWLWKTEKIRKMAS